jgi:two-component system chemotaxis response regulator CheB
LTASAPNVVAVRRDIVVIGGSAGSIEALRDLVPQLVPGLSVAVFVVVHVRPSSRSRLPQILDRTARMPVRHAADGDWVEPGRVLVAPPDRHLLLHPDRVELSGGPRENSSRPAIDPLFRSASEAFGPRVCAVVLSGHLDDGSDGLHAVVEAGGLALVQDPNDAAHPDMPLNALRRVPSAEVLSAMRLGRRIVTLVGAPAGAPTAGPAAAETVPPGSANPPGAPSGLTCPECGAVLWAEKGSRSLHCRGGHRFSLEGLREEQGLAVERAMWAAVRALREDAGLARHMAGLARDHGSEHTADTFERRRRSDERDAAVIEGLLFERESRAASPPVRVDGTDDQRC